jgi:prepilin peptidase CpaA
VSLATGLLLLYSALLAVAAVQDVRSLKISNWLCLATLAASVALVVLARQPMLPWQHAAAFAIAFGVGFVLFSMGWIGGGDAKLAAAAAALFTLGELGLFALITSLVGALLTILLLGIRGFRRRGGDGPPMRKSLMPYGVAIAIGAVLVAWMQVPREAGSALDRAMERNLPG